MKFLPYLLKHLRRNWLRTGLTVLAMALCIFLFCTLQSVLAEINALLDSTSAKRLVVRNSVSIVFDLPIAYGARIQSVPGVQRVAIVNWFGGALPTKKEGKTAEPDTTDWSNFFPNMAVELEPFFAMYPEFEVPPDQFAALLQDQRGAAIGRKLADKFGWKVGASSRPTASRTAPSSSWSGRSSTRTPPSTRAPIRTSCSSAASTSTRPRGARSRRAPSTRRSTTRTGRAR
jgi:putative ABC transport system permease protein